MDDSKVYCRSCQRRVTFITKADHVVLADHLCCDYSNCDDLCCQSGKTVENASMLPGWHRLHVHGLSCDGQDGMNSQCEREKRAGPPDAISRLGNLSD